MDAGEIKPSMLGMSSPCVQRAQRVKIEREEVEVFELDGEEEEVASSPVRARSTRPSAARSAGAQTEDEMDDEEEDATVLRPASYQDEEEVNGDETEDELEPVKQLPPSSPLPLPKRSSRAATPVLLPSSSPPRVARVEASPELVSSHRPTSTKVTILTIRQASTIKLRLQMALFKVLTNQTRVPVSRLSDPSREQALAFSRRREGKVEPMAVAPSGLESRYTLGREMSGMEGLAAAAAGREAV